MYDDLIMDHIRNARNYRVTENWNRKGEGSNTLCGDEVAVFLRVEREMLEDISFQCGGCGVSMASASIMTDLVKGLSAGAARAMIDAVETALHTRTGLPPACFAPGHAAIVATVEQFPSRALRATSMDYPAAGARRKRGRACRQTGRSRFERVGRTVSSASLKEEYLDRISLSGLIVLACSLAIPGLTYAQSYPVKPVRVVIGYPPGAGNDVIGRLVFSELSGMLGQPIVVDNRPGATGNIGAEIVARSPADGYTLLNAPGSISMAYSVFPRLPYDLLRDLQPVAIMASVSFLLVVHPSLPVTTVRELVRFAKSRPGQLSYATSGPGGGPHLTAEMFRMRAGLQLLHVPYRGTAQANAEIVSGQVTMIFSPAPSAMPHVKSGRVRALAITGDRRHASVPDVPTMMEAAYPDFESRNWIALFAPAGTPPAIIQRLNADINRIVETPVMQERFTGLGAESMSGSPEQWTAYVRAEVAKWAKVVKAAGVRLE